MQEISEKKIGIVSDCQCRV